MKYQLHSALLLLALGLALTPVGAGAGAANISGTWAFTVFVVEPEPWNVTFAFKQEGEKLSGTYYDLKGDEHPVSGTVKGDQVVFSYELASDKSSMKVNYTGTIESATKMTGTVGIPICGAGCKWTATKKK